MVVLRRQDDTKLRVIISTKARGSDERRGGVTVGTTVQFSDG